MIRPVTFFLNDCLDYLMTNMSFTFKWHNLLIFLMKKNIIKFNDSLLATKKLCFSIIQSQKSSDGIKISNILNFSYLTLK
ncbi:hypothetical protein BpHYR1_009991 [Brachionus plicatilis]|uniref:Uncharacterized protein n=1 Tax=Brachionus plicatilis TaxID=10195 RepID=A0A3M7RGB5_BRAPC|nr:hypothetical protein BpHYR1_009991 [Brachionus plicatilis]